MIDSTLATLVVAAHFAFIVFVVAGGFLVRLRPRLAWVHLPCALWGTFIEISGRVCPLTPLEVELRQRAGEAGYGESFVEHYLTSLVYPEGLTRPLQWALAGAVLAANVLAYGWALRSQRRR